MSAVLQYPPELLFTICEYIYAAGLPPSDYASSLDPLAIGEFGTPSALPHGNLFPSLCLVNHAWYEAAKPWLWHKIEVRLPRSWLALLDEITTDTEDDEKTALVFKESIQAATRAALASAVRTGASSDEDAVRKWKESIMESLTGPDGSIPPELLTPPASRDPSPRRLRPKSQSPARWKIMRTISDAVQNVMDLTEPGVYVPRLHDPRPGRFVRHLDFNHFRTIGMRRSIEDTATSRFVTGGRVEALLKELPNLTAFGATEYMDGALSLPVLNELLLRGSASRGGGRPTRGRGIVMDDPEEEDRERRRDCRDLQAMDLTGCVSAVFVSALTEFVNTHLLQEDEQSSGSDDESQRQRRARARFMQEEPLTFPGLRRLGLRGVKSIQPQILMPFVLAFPSLTHLDLSATRVTPNLLIALGGSSVRLHSLALARCVHLTGSSIRNFLVRAPAAARIRELTLYGDQTFPSPLTTEDLAEIISSAPCFTSGQLTYLDLSSAPVTGELLNDVCKPQPKLRSLGLSYIPDLELNVIAQFLKSKAMDVEVLTLVQTSPDLDWVRAGPGIGAPRGSAQQAMMALHTQIIGPLCTPPYMSTLRSQTVVIPPSPTRLRVIELSVPALAALGAGAGSWRIIRSKGSRGWYVDTASGWVGTGLQRNLPRGHPFRAQMCRLADANGNVNSGVGWHARKMEVLHGCGMMGREDGLYGAVSFAYQG
ncbi:hypothetical protein EDD22DRAFT_977024 [Suillus occidentalis]|nr:hypothetical protein EDD22DRAFT_977024 [Suillus occidentalis]